MKYDFICDCNAEKFSLIEKAVGGVNSYKKITEPTRNRGMDIQKLKQRMAALVK